MEHTGVASQTTVVVNCASTLSIGVLRFLVQSYQPYVFRIYLIFIHKSTHCDNQLSPTCIYLAPKLLSISDFPQLLASTRAL